MRVLRAILLAGCLTALVLTCAGAVGWGLWRYAETGIPSAVAPAPVTDIAVTPPSPSPAPLHATPEPGIEPADGQIAYIGEDGNVWIVTPGSDAIRLTDDASATSRAYRFPTWAPRGEILAFVELSLESGPAHDSAVHLITIADNTRVRIPTEYPPFYLNWSPTGETLAFLSNWDPGRMALRMIDVAGGKEEATTISHGSPFYFSWRPDGQELLAHIGTTDLAFLDQEGQRETLGLEGGLFQAPHWSADGERLAFVTRGEGSRAILSVSDADGTNVMEIAEDPGFFTFNWSPDSNRLAYSATSEQVGLPAFGPLWIHDLKGEQTETLISQPVVGFFWSPDGEKLAFLRPDLKDPAERVPQAKLQEEEPGLWVRWYVWDGESTTPLARFAPSRSFVLEYMRFFDQYAQSVSLWSPNSQHLLYAGTGEDGREGIWMLSIEEGSTPQRVARGEIATWSPR